MNDSHCSTRQWPLGVVVEDRLVGDAVLRRLVAVIALLYLGSLLPDCSGAPCRSRAPCSFRHDLVTV